MSVSQSSVLKVYKTVIDDVINASRDIFLDEGLDEQVVQELRLLWESKLVHSRAVESTIMPSSVSNMTAPVSSSATASSSNTGSSSSVDQQTTKARDSDLKIYSSKASSSSVTVTSSTIGGPTTDPKKSVPIQITLPQKEGSGSNLISIQIPVSVLNENKLTSVLSSSIIQTAMELPPSLAANLLQDHVNSKLRTDQLDGNRDSSDDELYGTSIIEDDFDEDNDQDENEDKDDDDDNDDYDDDKHDVTPQVAGSGVVSAADRHRDLDDDETANDEDPLNSGDDVSENDNEEMFETDNVVVCQYDKITRSRNKWKFYLKDGIMNLSGKDFVFQKCTGEAEW